MKNARHAIAIGMLLVALAIGYYQFIYKKKGAVAVENHPGNNPADEAAYQAMKADFQAWTQGDPMSWMYEHIAKRLNGERPLDPGALINGQITKTACLYSSITQDFQNGNIAGSLKSDHTQQEFSDHFWQMWVAFKTANTTAFAGL